MPEDQAPEPSQWLAEELALQLARAMESMTGEPVAISHTPFQLNASEIDVAQSGLLWWEQALSLAADARIWTAAGEASWQEIGNRVLRSAGVEDGDAENIRSTYLEIVNQALSSVASAASARARKEISCGESRPAAPPGLEAGSAYSFDMRIGDQSSRILAVFSPAIVNLGANPGGAPPQPAKESAAAAKPASAPGGNTSSIDLLLDVELPVSVSFGRAQLPLKDVIKLTTGSIVELNRSVSEPVEVIVNNCVIARGEVVVIEGNYGIRIQQVISRQERLRTLY